MRTRPKGHPHGRVLLLGGSNFDLRLKRRFLTSPLLDAVELATFEPRGIGRSDLPDGAWSMQDYAKDALSYMDAIGWHDAHIIGESFGGMTALHMANMAPARVSSMVLTSTTSGGAGGASFDVSEFLDLPRKEAAERALCLQDVRAGDARMSDPDAYKQMLNARLEFEEAFADPSINSGGYAKLLDARRDHNIWGALPEIKTPTLVIAGIQDRQAPQRAQKAMAAALENGSFWLLNGGHGVLFESPAVSQAILTEWLDFNPMMELKRFQS
ncbi:MAG: alpha/beta hydrolase [Pseudomonadota bacterium]|nr:alpha/beta hydrolase [Pseudomonadota bacterium]